MPKRTLSAPLIFLALLFASVLYHPQLVYASYISVQGASLSQARVNTAGVSVGEKVLFAGGNYTDSNGYRHDSGVVDIYDAASRTWSQKTISSRSNMFTAVVGSKAIFAGGDYFRSCYGSSWPTLCPSYKLTIYDDSTGVWSEVLLPDRGRHHFVQTVASSLDKVFIASNGVVDVYDTSTGALSVKYTPNSHSPTIASSVGDKVYFSGGENNNVVDVYDVSSDTWSSINQPQVRDYYDSATAGSKILFTSVTPQSTAYPYWRDTVVDVLDTSTNSWTTTNILNGDRPDLVSWGDKVIFYNGHHNAYVNPYPNNIDVFDSSTNTFSHTYLSKGRLSATAVGLAGGSRIYVGGGVWRIGSQPQTYTSSVQVFADSDLNNSPISILNTDGATFPTGESKGFDGSSSYDPDLGDYIVNFSWNFGDGNTVSGATLANINHTYNTVGVYSVSLTVKDQLGAEKTSTIVVNVIPSNQPPTAEAGLDQTVLVNELVSLDGSGSSDPDGDPLIYFWSEDTSNPQVDLVSNLMFVNPSFTPTIAGTYTFSLVVNDGAEDSLPDSVVIVVQTSAEGIQELIELVESYNLQQGIDNNLDAKLDAALNALDDVNQNNDQAAINTLYSFINAVEAQSGTKITIEQTDALIFEAQRIINSLSY